MTTTSSAAATSQLSLFPEPRRTRSKGSAAGIELTIWELAQHWRSGAGCTEKLEKVAEAAEKLSGSGEVERLLEAVVTRRTRADADEIRERAAVYDSQDDEVPFSTSAFSVGLSRPTETPFPSSSAASSKRSSRTSWTATESPFGN